MSISSESASKSAGGTTIASGDAMVTTPLLSSTPPPPPPPSGNNGGRTPSQRPPFYFLSPSQRGDSMNSKKHYSERNINNGVDAQDYDSVASGDGNNENDDNDDGEVSVEIESSLTTTSAGSSEGIPHRPVEVTQSDTKEIKYNTTEIPARLLVKRRIQLEPKIPLANERTLLAWFHWATLMAGSALALTSFKAVEHQPIEQFFGLFLLPLSIVVIVYALNQYGRRAYLLREGVSKGVYYDTVGPMCLGFFMIISLVGSFCFKLFDHFTS